MSVAGGSIERENVRGENQAFSLFFSSPIFSASIFLTWPSLRASSLDFSEPFFRGREFWEDCIRFGVLVKKCEKDNMKKELMYNLLN